MPNIIRVPVDDPAGTITLYGGTAYLVAASGTAESGDFTAFSTATVDSGTALYPFYHAAGTAGTWYEWQLYGTAGTSSWSSPFQGDGLDSYALLEELWARLDLPDETEYPLLWDILEAVSGQFDAEAHRQFYRIPAVSGTATRYYDGNGESVLFVPEGIVSLTQVEVADATGGTFSTIATADWFLRPKVPSATWPYTELHLDGYVFTDGWDTVRLTGIFGWSAVPALIREAVLQLAARTYHESKTRHAGIAGMAETGLTSVPPFRPDAWFRALQAFGRRVTA